MLLRLLTPGAIIVKGGSRREWVSELLRQPWRYKQLPQADAGRMLAQIAQEQSRQLASSQA
jgi:hypothetical protein